MWDLCSYWASPPPRENAGLTAAPTERPDLNTRPQRPAEVAAQVIAGGCGGERNHSGAGQRLSDMEPQVPTCRRKLNTWMSRPSASSCFSQPFTWSATHQMVRPLGRALFTRCQSRDQKLKKGWRTFL